jgi:hypothetical protein
MTRSKRRAICPFQGRTVEQRTFAPITTTAAAAAERTQDNGVAPLARTDIGSPAARGGGVDRHSEPGASPLLPHNDYPARARRQRQVEHLHELGPRAMAEFLDELARRYDIADAIRDLLADYGRLSPDELGVTGGDRFAPAPARRVSR